MACALDFGCSHYQRKCKLVAPCCGKSYSCRFCHDDVESHQINRKAIKEVICLICDQKQTIRSNCLRCKVRFGKYFCRECNLFDDEDKGQFHCRPCGLCRVGGENNYFHCEVCNMCLALFLLGQHTCVEERSHTDCPVCLEDMHSSRAELHVSTCGHLLHKTCYEKLEASGHHLCPICKKQFKP